MLFSYFTQLFPEIPPRQRAYTDLSYQASCFPFGGGFSGGKAPKASGVTTEAKRPVKKPVAAAASKKEVNLNFDVGDRIKHKVFGLGVIEAKKKAANDFLVTLLFDDGQKKNFLLRTASVHMEKVE